ncbi:SDR family NAD(P)-dependent oxidoreductase [Streptomyces canus]|jgi:NAD(P)-dependent dehydrogenase (short-subunit alcohol dehydrogenase family)|uniref:SDR family NAD(P)-dependent oxidoreductase n=1 Tax=Streptomyces canus TaxID=58343 RepID=UPI003712A90F
MADLVFVTGGSRGIGKSIAERLLKDGYRVLICSRNEAELSATTAELKTHGDISGTVLDIGDRSQVRRFCEDFNEPLYGLVNNAGVVSVETIEQNTDTLFVDTSHWDDIISVNLGGVYFLTKGLLPHVPDGGRIVNIASQLAKEGRSGYAAYCASKFGLLGMTKSWAKELGRRRITANAICPGWVRTALAVDDMNRLAAVKGVPPDDFYDEICGPIELKRFSEPSEVAGLTSFLLSADGAGISGRDWLMHTVWNQE